ncbi:hypothetical protein ABT076_10380 [Streptomyces sp. NPDC002131]|uniref:hypothetical protein n=1 Tax=Streptomyces sp. NPDC002131 TaxID=3154535 RepID=UPI00331910B2
MRDIEQMLIDIRFYDQILGDSKRTIICPPGLADRVRAVIEAHSAGDRYTVRASAACPDDKLIAIDEQALEASFQQAAQRGLRNLYR